MKGVLLVGVAKSSRGSTVILGCIFIAVSLFSLGAIKANSEDMLYLQHACTKEADGKLSTCLSYTDSRDGRVTTMYTPVYGFYVHGEYYECKSSASKSWRPSGNATKAVKYNSDNPNECYLKGEEPVKQMAAGIIILSVFLLVGIYLVFIDVCKYFKKKG